MYIFATIIDITRYDVWYVYIVLPYMIYRTRTRGINRYVSEGELICTVSSLVSKEASMATDLNSESTLAWIDLQPLAVVHL